MKKIVFLPLFFVSFFGCKNSSRPIKKPLDATLYFDSGLRKSFQTRIPEAPHIYIVINDGCTGCRQITAEFFDSILRKNSDEPVTVLVRTPHSLDPNFLSNPRVIVNDTTDFFRLWFFGYNTITLIGTSNKKIDAILNFDSPDMDSLPIRYSRLKQRAGP